MSDIRHAHCEHCAEARSLYLGQGSPGHKVGSALF